jgi:predicted transposase YbfD/YdcC
MSLDVASREDDTLITSGHTAENVSILKTLALNILRLDS